MFHHQGKHLVVGNTFYEGLSTECRGRVDPQKLYKSKTIVIQALPKFLGKVVKSVWKHFNSYQIIERMKIGWS